MNRNSNGILVADNLPKTKKLSKVVSQVMHIPNEHKPVAEFMELGEREEGYTAVYILTTSAKEARELKRKKFTLVEQPVKTEAADDEWLEHPDYADMEHLKAAYEWSVYFTISGGDLYTSAGCAEVDEYMVYCYRCKSKSMLVFTLCGKVTEIRYF